MQVAISRTVKIRHARRDLPGVSRSSNYDVTGLGNEAQTRTPESDWVWLAVLALWQRWWPAKPCLETLDDKIQDGYAALRKHLAAATDRWLDAWSDVLALCDAVGVTTIAAFDGRFPVDPVAVQLEPGPGDGTGQRGPR